MALHHMNVVARCAVAAAESLEQGRDRTLRCLELVGHRDAVAVVPDRHDKRRTEHADRVEAFPEDALGRPGVADRGEADLVAVAREAPRHRAERRRLAVELGGPGQADRARHLRADRRKIRSRLTRREEILPAALFVEDARREVTQHLATRGVGIAHDVRVGVELGEVLRQIGETDREHEGLVAVVARSPIAGPESARHGQLCDLLTFPRDAERRLSDEHLTSRELARRPAAHREAIVGDDLRDGEAELRVRGRDGDLGTGARLHSPSMLPFRCRRSVEIRRRQLPPLGRGTAASQREIRPVVRP